MAFTLKTYTSAVRHALQDANISAIEMETVHAGIRYGIGPYDCACQILADRSDRDGVYTFPVVKAD